VQQGDGGLDLIRARPLPAHGPVEHGGGLVNGGPAPQGAVLVFEQHRIARGVEAGPVAGVGGQQEREKPRALGLVGHQGVEEPGQPDALFGQVDAHRNRAARRRRGVGLGEHQVHGEQDGGQPLGQLVIGGDPVGDAGLGDLGLGPHDALGERGLGNQIGGRDLRRREPAQGAQSQGDAGLGSQAGVAAGEDQPQQVVADRRLRVVRLSGRRPACVRAREVGRRRGPAIEGRHLEAAPDIAQREALLGCPLGFAAQSVDGRPLGRGGQPGPGVGGHTGAGPGLEGGDGGVLQRVFGQVEIAEGAGEGGHHSAALTPDDLGQRQLVGQGQPAWVKSMQGRTSTLPCHAPGIWAAHWTASSRFSHLRR
jgi:hypothetical protein